MMSIVTSVCWRQMRKMATSSTVPSTVATAAASITPILLNASCHPTLISARAGRQHRRYPPGSRAAPALVDRLLMPRLRQRGEGVVDGLAGAVHQTPDLIRGLGSCRCPGVGSAAQHVIGMRADRLPHFQVRLRSFV